MTLAPSQRYKLYQPIVATDRFEIPFPIFGVDDLTVFIDRVEEPLFSVEATFQNSRADGAVIVLTAPVFDVDVEIYGTRTPRRDSNYLNNDPNLAQRLQSDQDMLTAVQQEQAREYLRTLRVGTNDPFVGPLEGTEADRAGKAMIFSSDGKSLEVGPTADQIANAESYAERAEFAAETIEDAITINGVGRASGDGVTTVFTLPISITSKNNVDVIINGVQQFKTAYEVSGNQITFVSAPPTGSNNIEFNCKGNFSGVVDTLPQGLTTPTLVAAAASSIPDVVEQVLLSGWFDTGDRTVSALFKRVDGEPSHTAKFQSQDGGWWERIIDQHGVAVPWYGPCDTDANRRQTLLDAYAHWSALNASAYATDIPPASCCPLTFPPCDLDGDQEFDVGTPHVALTTVGSDNVIEGSTMMLRNVQLVAEDVGFKFRKLNMDGAGGAWTAIVLGTENGRADQGEVHDINLFNVGRPIHIADISVVNITNIMVDEMKQGMLVKSYDYALNNSASGNATVSGCRFWHSEEHCLEVRSVGEVKFNNCVFYDADKPNIVISGSALTGERALQGYFTDCTSTIGHDDLSTREQTSILSVTDNGAGKVRVNFASGAMPFLFEGQRLVQFDFAGVYTDGLYTISNVTAASVDIETLTYSETTTGTVYHPGWDLVIENDGAPVLPTTETYDLYFTGGNINRVYVGASHNVNFEGTSIPLQLYASEDCQSLTRIGTGLGRYGTAEENVPISGPGKWAEISNLKEGADFGAVIRTPDDTATYGNGLASVVNTVKVTSAGVTIDGSVLDVKTPRLTLSETPRFLAYLNTSMANVTGNSGSAVTVAFDTEVYDNAGNFSAGVFTAPFDGDYHFDVAVALQQIGTATQVYVQLVTPAGNYDSREEAASLDATRMTLRISQDVRLSEGQTAYVTARVQGLAGDTADIVGGSATRGTTFSGRLIG